MNPSGILEKNKIHLQNISEINFENIDIRISTLQKKIDILIEKNNTYESEYEKCINMFKDIFMNLNKI